MKCKNCGGELQYQNGVWQCKSCGVSGTLDSVYENIDVCICYEENDATGRRTRDSIIAQEVYRKLEENKVATFYERISADGMIGSDLDASKITAIQKAKIIIVLGTSLESFASIETKYGEYFTEKPVIPFCVDVNPGAIPKTLSKIQAMSYSTIGWDKDLIKGIYNILGREPLVDVGSLYEKRKVKFVIIGIIVAVIAIAVGISAWIFLKPNDETDTSSTGDSTESTTLSQKEIYDKANDFWAQGKYIEALKLFLQIPDYANSTNMIKKIYSQYEGYYQKDGTTLHIEIVDNSRADLEVTILKEGNTIRIVESAELLTNSITLAYVDNLQNSGNLQLFLENAGLRLRYGANETDFAKIFFELEAKSDKPIIQLDSTTMLNWLKNKYSFSQIRALGYELDAVEPMTSMEFPDDENTLYKIKDTEIYLSMVKFYYDGNDEYWFDEQVLVGIAAPAEWIAPTQIGKNSLPVYEDDIIYWPNGYLFHYSSGGFSSDYFSSEQWVSENTIVGVAYKTSILNHDWDRLIKSVFERRVLLVAKEKYNNPDGYVYASVYGENQVDYLVKVEASILGYYQCAWYKINKDSKTVTFIQEGPYDLFNSNLADLYPDLAVEFPSAFGGNKGNAQTQIGETSFTFKVKNEGHNIYSQPSYDSTTVQSISIGAYTIVEEQTDSDGNAWGKLKSGLGWICISDIQG